ncbi:MAG: hypothetical protein ACTSYS_10795 [Promethearchaeota archaeon]
MSARLIRKIRNSLGIIIFFSSIMISISVNNYLVKENSSLNEKDVNSSGDESIAFFSAWSQNDKEIDGVISYPEWYTSYNRTINDVFDVNMFIENDEDFLYIGLRTLNTDLSALSTIMIIFDKNNDGAIDYKVGEPFFQYNPNSGMLQYGLMKYLGAIGEYTILPAGCKAMASYNSEDDYIDFELRVTLSSLEIVPGDIVPMLTVLQGGAAQLIYPNNIAAEDWMPIHTSMKDTNAPVLSAGTITSSGPPYNTSLLYSFNVNYSDADNDAPFSISLILDNISFPMEKVNPSDTNYIDGCNYTVSIHLSEGIHEYYFEATERLFISRFPQFGYNYTPNITHVNVNAPLLSNPGVSAQSGDTQTPFTFMVKYKDLDNNEPENISVIIDGSPHQMEPLLNMAHDYVSGVYYKYETKLANGSHSYYFNCTDGVFATREPVAGVFSGPTVTTNANNTALFDGLYIKVEFPSNSYVAQMTGINNVYHDLGNGSYSCDQYILYFSNWLLLQTNIIDQETGVVFQVFDHLGTSLGVQLLEVGDRDHSWIPLNTQLNDTFTFNTFNGDQNFTVTGETWQVFNGKNRSCWVLTTSLGDEAYYDKATGILIWLYLEDINDPLNATLVDSNAFNFFAPVINSLAVNPSNGNGTTPFTFTCNVSDLDSVTPMSIELYIDDLPFRMQEENDSLIFDYTMVNGKIFSKTLFLTPGVHEFHVEVDDGLYKVRYPASTNQSISVTSVNNHAPVLSKGQALPFKGQETNIFFFIVNYSDADNNAPVSINVTVGGLNYSLQQYFGGDLNLTDGSYYYVKLNLTENSYSYHFSVDDGGFTARYPSTGDLNMTVSSTPKRRFFTNAIAQYTTLMYGSLTYEFTNVDSTTWHVDEILPVTSSTGYYDFNNFTRVVVSGNGTNDVWGMSSGNHDYLFIHQNMTLNDHILIYNPNSRQDEDFRVSDVVLVDLGDDRIIACWELVNVNNSDTKAYYEESLGLLINFEISAGFMAPFSFNFSLIDTNLFNDYPLTVNATETPNGSYWTNQTINFSLSCLDLDGFEPINLTLTINGSIIDLLADGERTGDSWAQGVNITYSRYFSPGIYSWRIYYSDGIHSGHVPTSVNGSFTVIYVNNHAPELLMPSVTPNATHNYTTPIYTVLYKDADNNAPDNLTVLIDGVPHQCSQWYPNESNYVDGELFYFLSPALLNGVHNYSFNVSDGLFTNQTQVYSGPSILNDSFSTLFDGMTSEFLLQSGGNAIKGNYLYSKIFSLYNVSTIIQGSPASTGFKIINSIGTVLYDDSIFKFISGSSELSWFRPAIVNGSGKVIFLYSNYFGNREYTLSGPITYNYNGQLRPAWLFVNGTNSSVVVDQDTGITLNWVVDTGYIYSDINYTLLSTSGISLYPPVINSVNVSQSSGDIKTLFTFQANVTDADSVAPEVSLIINGTAYEMHASSITPDFENGEIFTCSLYLQPGNWNWLIKAEDHYGWVFSSNEVINVSDVNTHAPQVDARLVTPHQGDNYTWFVFELNFTDQDNNAPAHVHVNINGTNYLMSPVDPLDTNFMDGALYRYETQLAANNYSYVYYYNASDGLNEVINPSNGSYGDLNVRSGALTILADDLGYGYTILQIYSYQFLIEETFLLAHDNSTNFTVFTNVNGTSGSFTLNNETRNMTDYIGAGNFQPENTSDTLWYWRNISINQTLSIETSFGIRNLTVTGTEIVEKFGYRMHCFVLEDNFTRILYDMETGYLVSMIQDVGGFGLILATPDYNTAFNNHYLPSLANLTLENATGNQSVQRTFRCTFFDGDGNVPGRHQVVINGYEIDLVEEDPNDTDTTDGKDYYFSAYLQPGTYFYHFRFSDNLTTVISPAINSTSFNVSYSNLNTPALENASLQPSLGYPDSIFSFKVLYSDIDNNEPTSVYLTLWGGNLSVPVNYMMSPVDPFDTNFMDGVEFYLNLSLAPGDYNYNFSANDSAYATTLPLVGNYSGPFVRAAPPLNSSNLENITIGIISNYYGGDDPLNRYWQVQGDLLARNASFLYLPAGEPISREFLESINILWIGVYGFTSMTVEQLNMIYDWVEFGGGCLFLIKPSDSRQSSQILSLYNIYTIYSNYISSDYAGNISSHPVTTNVSSLYFSGMNYYLDLGYATRTFETLATLAGYPQVVVYESNSTGKIIVINDDELLISYLGLSQADNRLLVNNSFGWLARYNQFSNLSLSNLTYSPGAPNNSAPITFSGNYSDPLDDYKPVFINISIDGRLFPMNKANMGSYNYDTGEIYEYTTYLQDGSHDVYVIASDGGSLYQTTTIQVNVSRVDLYEPNITSWMVYNVSHNYTKFVYMCNYSDSDNNAPNNVWIYIDNGSAIQMQKLDSDDMLFIDGVIYYHETFLNFSTHSYYVQTTDDGSHFVRDPPVGTHSGPLVLNTSDVHGIYDTMNVNWTWYWPWGDSDDYMSTFSLINNDLYNISRATLPTLDPAGYRFVNITDRLVSDEHINLGPWFSSREFLFVPQDLLVNDSLYIYDPSMGNTNFTVSAKHVMYYEPLGRYFLVTVLDSTSSSSQLFYDQKTGLLLLAYLSDGSRFEMLNFSSMNNDNIPILNESAVIPTIKDAKTLLTFRVNYLDINNDHPMYMDLVFNNFSVTMHRVNSSDFNYTDGCLYEAQLYLQAGAYSYYITTTDGVFDVNSPASGGFNISVSSVPNFSPPVLSNSSVNPVEGYNYTVYRFKTTYTDAENNAPTYINVNFNGTYYSLQKLDTLDTNYMDGMVYYRDIIIHEEGYYNYYFNASDENYTARDPVNPDAFYIGPNVTARLEPVQNYTLQNRSYAWENTSSGIELNIHEDYSTSIVNLPFNMSIYDTNLRQILVSGYLFIRFLPGVNDYYHDYVPSDGLRNRYIVGLETSPWMDYSYGGYVRVVNLTGPDRVVIEYGNIYNGWYSGSTLVTFQIVLYSNGEFILNVQDYSYTWGNLFINYGDGQAYTIHSINNSTKNASYAFVYPDLDPFPPDLSIISPVNGTTYYSETINVDLDSISPDLDQAWYNIYNLSSGAYLFANITYNFGGVNQVTISGSGGFRIDAWANDTSGKMTYRSLNFSVDLTQPEAYITFPLNSTYTTTTFSYSFSGNPSTASIIYNTWNHSSGSWIGVNQTITSPWPNSAPPVSLSGGYYTIYAWGVTSLNVTQATPTTLMFLVDLIDPEIWFTSPLNNSIKTSKPMNITINSNDADGKISSTWWNIFNRTSSTWLYSQNQTYFGTFFLSIPDGMYYIQAWTNDSANHVSTNTSYFMLDTIDPIVDHPPDMSVSINQSNVTITWNIDDIIAGQYRVERNGSAILNWTSWFVGVPIDVLVDTNVVTGTYNYTIFYNDGAGHSGTPDSVLVYISLKPSANSTPLLNDTILENTSYYINWTLYTMNTPGYYRILRDGVVQVNWTPWIGNDAIHSIMVDTNIGLGEFNYTIEYNDSLSYGDPNTVLINVNDVPNATIIPDFVVPEGSSQVLDWIITDLNDGNVYYKIQRNGSDLIPWTPTTNGSLINFSIDTSTAGIFNYTLFYNDSFGFVGIPRTTIVTVNDPPVSSSPADLISLQNVSVSWITWNITDIYGGAGEYSILRDGVTILSGLPWSSGVNFSVQVDTDSGIGIFNYTLMYNDSYGLSGIQDEVFVTVNDIPTSNHPADIFVNEGQSGVTINWTISDIMTGVGFYDVLRNGSLIAHNANFTSGVSVQFPVSTNISFGVWNYTIRFADSFGIIGEQDVVFVTLNDMPKSTSPADRLLNENSTSMLIGWVLTDNYGGNGFYKVYRNGSEITAWLPFSSGINYTVPVDSNIGVGDWNYTIVFNDTYGLFGMQDEVIITINDHPVSTHPADKVVLLNAAGVQVGWVITDMVGGSGLFQVYRNGTPQTGWIPYSSGHNNTVPIITTELGVWNYTIKFNDTHGLFGTQDEVLITVNDVPVANNVPGFSVGKNDTGAVISWNITDVIGSQGNYQVFVNGSPYNSGSWISGNEIDITIDTNHGIGDYNYTLMYWDVFGANGSAKTTIISVKDLPISNHPADVVVLNGSSQAITWIITDSVGPGQYRVILGNGSEVVTWTSWVNASPIVVSVNTGVLGIFNYTIEYNNSAGQYGHPDSVFVTVNDAPVVTSPADFMAVENQSSVSISWTINDVYGGNGMYRVLRNATPVTSWSPWTSGSPINVNVNTNVGIGDWNYTIIFNDTYGTGGTGDSVIVTINDKPRLNLPASMIVEQNATSASFSCQVNDTILGSGSYQVSRNGTVISSWLPWTSGSNFSVSVDTNIGFGYWNYSLVINDSHAVATGFILVLVEDKPIASPGILSLQAYQNSTGISINWTITDRFGNGEYRLLLNGTPLTSYKSWVNNTPAVESVSTDIGLGFFNYTIEFRDSNGITGDESSIIVRIIADNTPPVIGNLSTNLPVSSDVAVVINCSAFDNQTGISSVLLYYSINGSSTFTSVVMSSIGGSNYSGQIPAQGFGSRVSYYIEARDAAGNTARDDNSGAYYNYTSNYLSIGSHTIEFLSPYHLSITIQVTSPGVLSVSSFNASNLLSSLELEGAMASFDITFAGGFSSISVTYMHGSSLPDGKMVVYHEIAGSWTKINSIVDASLNTITFNMTSLSRFIIGFEKSQAGGPVGFAEFFSKNWYIFIIIGAGAMIAVGAMIASKKKKTMMSTKPVKKKTISTKTLPEEKQWIKPATTEMLDMDSIKKKIKHLFVFHGKTGVCLFYQPFSEKTIDPQLIAGFLSAIYSFGSSFEENAELRVLEYKDFKILMEETVTCRYALLFSGELDDTLNKLLKAFIGEFESKFRKQLQEFNGNVSVFNIASEIMQNIFKGKSSEVSAADAVSKKAMMKAQGVSYFHLYCPVCQKWYKRREGIKITGTETCKVCHQPLYFVPKCEKCGHTIIVNGRDYDSFKANPPKCDRCGGKMQIQ